MITFDQEIISKKIYGIAYRILPWLLGILVCYIGYCVFIWNGLFCFGYFGLYLIGLVSSLFSMMRLLGVNFYFLNKLCGDFEYKYNCDSVIASKGAYVIGDITWSDVGIIYFICMLLICMLAFDENLLIYIVTSLGTVPYIFYSVYYQMYVLRSWCLLCIIVQIVFLLALILSCLLLFSSKFSSFSIVNTIPIILIVLVVLIGYLCIKYLLKSIMLYKNEAVSYRNFKLQYVETCFWDSKQAVTLPDTLVFHQNAKVRISVVFSFGCTPCVYKLSEIIRTIENDPNIAIEFIFYSNSKRLKQELPLILYFMNLYFTRNEREFLHELRQYVMNYPNSKKTVIDLWNKNEEVNEKLRYSVKEHFRWCVLNDIRMTPTYLLNGRFVDGHYTLEEIKRIAINM